MISAASLSASAKPILGGAPCGTAPLGVKISANSRNSPSGFHSLLPSARPLVWASARRSAIHLRTCSSGTGPYSLSSPPIILYIVVLSPSENTFTRHQVAEIRMPSVLSNEDWEMLHQ